MVRGIAVLLILLTVAAQSSAQPSRPNAMLRNWPISGGWYVVLVRARSLGGKPACLMTTGYATATTPDYRIWGMRAGGDEIMLITNSKRHEDVAGPEIEVSVDGYVVGRFQITDRPSSPDGVMTAAASVIDESSRRKLVDLVHAGSDLRFRNGEAVYQATLDPRAAENFEECRREAELLAQ